MNQPFCSMAGVEIAELVVDHDGQLRGRVLARIPLELLAESWCDVEDRAVAHRKVLAVLAQALVLLRRHDLGNSDTHDVERGGEEALAGVGKPRVDRTRVGEGVAPSLGVEPRRPGLRDLHLLESAYRRRPPAGGNRLQDRVALSGLDLALAGHRHTKLKIDIVVGRRVRDDLVGLGIAGLDLVALEIARLEGLAALKQVGERVSLLRIPHARVEVQLACLAR